LEEAATLLFSASTAQFVLCELGQSKPGQKVLINDASGCGVTLALPIGKLLEVRVTAVCVPVVWSWCVGLVQTRKQFEELNVFLPQFEYSSMKTSF